MTIEGVVVEGQCTNDDAAGLGHGHGSLGSELVFLVGLAFADAGDVWLMEAVNFARVGTLLALNAVIEVKRLSVDFKRFRRKLPPHIADQDTGNSPQTSDSPLGLALFAAF